MQRVPEPVAVQEGSETAAAEGVGHRFYRFHDRIRRGQLFHGVDEAFEARKRLHTHPLPRVPPVDTNYVSCRTVSTVASGTPSAAIPHVITRGIGSHPRTVEVGASLMLS